MVMSVGCSSASALTLTLDTKPWQYQTNKPVTGEFSEVDNGISGYLLKWTLEDMKAKIAKDLNKKVEEVKVLDTGKIKERYALPEGTAGNRKHLKMVKVNKKDLMTYDIVKIEDSYYNFKEIEQNKEKLLTATVLMANGGMNEGGVITSLRPGYYKTNIDGTVSILSYKGEEFDGILPVVSQCMMVAGTEYKIFLPSKGAFLRDKVDVRFARDKSEHVVAIQIID